VKPSTAETLLKWLLRLDGVIMSSAIIAVFFPDALMHWMHERLGLGQMPTASITEYLARSCSVLYAMHGAIVVYVSTEPRRQWQLVRWIVILHMLLGLIIFGIDLNAGMPWYWTAAEGLPIFALATFMLWLWHRANSNRDLIRDPIRDS
jgi:hypothetical protein